MRWIIGDIHGMLRPLEALVTAVERRDPGAHWIFAGDYVNRGPDSRRVIDLLVALPHATFLRGNHDDVFDLLLRGDCYICHTSAPDSVGAFTWFMQHGLAETLMSYGADWAELENLLHRPSPARIERLVQAVPASHREFIRNLRPVYETDSFFVAHGYWDPDESDSSPTIGQQLEADPRLRYELLWGRFAEQEIRRRKRWKRTGYFGHTPVFNYRSAPDRFAPVRGPQIVLLDTAAALSVAGRLSAICAETGDILQAERSGAVAELPA